MYTRRHFLNRTALIPIIFAARPFLRMLSAQESANLPSRLPAPTISTKARIVHKRALVFDGHVHALDREFYNGGASEHARRMVTGTCPARRKVA